jgi:restriction system protein
MPVPTYDQFIEPVLRYLADHVEGVPAPIAHDAAATSLGLSEEDRAVLLPSGQQRMYKNRAGWAHDRLKRAGLSTSPKHGFWRLTEAGIAFAKAHPGRLQADLVEKLSTDYMGVRLKVPGASANETAGGGSQAAGVQPPPANVLVGSSLTATPDDLLEQALSDLNAAANDELLERLATVSPSFFEVIVLDVLHRMGYGAKRADLQRVGGSGDAGIDGVISLDKLGLEKVYVQAKRWREGVVGRPELQAFYGALAGQKAKKGIFITTSTYSAQARDFVKSVDGIVLIDGERLASLMIDCEVGVTSRLVRIPKIDSDYFDEGGA